VIATARVFLQIALGALGLSGGRRRVREKVLAALHRKHRRHRFGVPGDVKADRFQGFSFSVWLAHMPPELVMAYLHIDKATLDAIPREAPLITPI